jgi:hypothetical protein
MEFVNLASGKYGTPDPAEDQTEGTETFGASSILEIHDLTPQREEMNLMELFARRRTPTPPNFLLCLKRYSSGRQCKTGKSDSCQLSRSVVRLPDCGPITATGSQSGSKVLFGCVRGGFVD